MTLRATRSSAFSIETSREPRTHRPMPGTLPSTSLVPKPPRCCDRTSLAEPVLGLQIPELGWPAAGGLLAEGTRSKQRTPGIVVHHVLLMGLTKGPGPSEMPVRLAQAIWILRPA